MSIAGANVVRTIPAALDRAVERFAAAEALIEDGMRLSWAQVGERAREVAAALHASGIRAGDRVAIWAPNIAEWVLVSLGAHYIGAVIVPVNTRFRAAEATHVLRTARARMLFTVTDFLQTDYVALLQTAGVPPSIEEIVVLRGPDTGALSWTRFLSRAASVPPSTVRALSAAVQPDTLSEIMFTSGTTGAPKGAMLTHGMSTHAMAVLSEIIGLRAGDRYLIINPFFHVFGLKAGILSCTLVGAAMIVESVFDVPRVLALIEAERISVFPGPPTIYRSLLDHADLRHHDTSTLRLALTGAATVPVELIHRMSKELTFTTIATAYGLTEATGLVSTCRPDDDPEVIATTAGRPIPDIEVRLVDEQGRDVPRGQAGEILVRGYNVMKGYFEDEASTALAIDAEGYLHTGDIAVQDRHGNLRITDRKKDMFIVGGFNAYPAEIEAIIRQHPDVADAAVVGVPDARLGEVGMAHVVLKQNRALAADALHAWCRERMANFKVPRQYAFIDALPVSATGKVLKYRLREMALKHP